VRCGDEFFHGRRRLYVDPPAHAIVLSVDEKSQIQELDRTQPALPRKKGCAGTMTHHYERHGTTTLFAAMNVLDGTVIGRNMQRHRHRHQEFIRFLNVIEKQVPAGKTIHAIVDNYAAHKHPSVRRWIERHPRLTFRFTRT
jgi:transposase